LPEKTESGRFTGEPLWARVVDKKATSNKGSKIIFFMKNFVYIL
jgi:hypothetical protein